MSTLNQIDDSQYKADFDIAKGYIDFSSELLRLSLLAMGGFGTLALVRFQGDGNTPHFLQNPKMFLVSMAFFALCAGATLSHRYFASDFMAWYIAWLRADAAGNMEKAEKEKAGVERCLELANGR
ncbi:hypothetical protein [Aridibaculum aurantiacum]|uniref:hypothetical protein n=1 Tax=Aridibaculum aurantiacum TaxID=2810307 RepID=UPI001A979775|nr:hypothetical protein [Aridibaculum aurantiacum]